MSIEPIHISLSTTTPDHLRQDTDGAGIISAMRTYNRTGGVLFLSNPLKTNDKPLPDTVIDDIFGRLREKVEEYNKNSKNKSKVVALYGVTVELMSYEVAGEGVSVQIVGTGGGTTGSRDTRVVAYGQGTAYVVRDDDRSKTTHAANIANINTMPSDDVRYRPQPEGWFAT